MPDEPLTLNPSPEPSPEPSPKPSPEPQPELVSVHIAEMQLLTSIAQCMIEAGLLMSNPPQLITPNGKQDHQTKINQLINKAGALSMQWGLAKGILAVEEHSPLVVAT